MPNLINRIMSGSMARVGVIFADCLEASGGPFLMGRFSAVDDFYAHVLTRIRTYQFLETGAVRAFAAALDNLPAWQEWCDAALAETAVTAADEIK